MPTNKPQFSLTMDEDMMDKIDDLRFSTRAKSRNVLINKLIKIGYEKIEKEMNAKEGTLNSEESTAEVQNPLEALTDILSKAGWLGKNGDISDADSRFLSAMLDAIHAHFEN